MEEKWLPEQLKTIGNLCDIARILIICEMEELLPTILELMYEEAQTVVLENCVKC